VRRAHNLVAKSRPARSIERPRTFETPEKRCVRTKATIVSCRKVRSARGMRPDARKAIGAQSLTGARESSGGRKDAGTGSGQDGFRMGTVAGTHLALTSSRPGHTRVSSHSPERKRHDDRRWTADRTPLAGASALHGVSGTSSESHLGSTLGSGKSCPDPGRLSTFGVSGLCPCRRLTYRGACPSILPCHPMHVKLHWQQF
jgi:hypothetical protein